MMKRISIFCLAHLSAIGYSGSMLLFIADIVYGVILAMSARLIDPAVLLILNRVFIVASVMAFVLMFVGIIAYLFLGGSDPYQALNEKWWRL